MEFEALVTEKYDWREIIYPNYTVPLIRQGEKRREVFYSEWGMVPRFAMDKGIRSKYATFNASIETIETSRLYSPPWKDNRRCIIPAQTFVEWTGEKGKKTPLEIRPVNRKIFGIAGLWDKTDMPQLQFDTFTMLTCGPNAFIAPFHGRMPVILNPSDYDQWLSPHSSPEDVKNLLKPYEDLLEVI